MAGGPEGSLVIETFGSSLTPLWGLVILLLFGDGMARLLRQVGIVRYSGRTEAAGLRILLGLAMVPLLYLVMDLASIPITRWSSTVVMLAIFGTGLLVARRARAADWGTPAPGVHAWVDPMLLRSPAAIVLILAIVSVVLACTIQSSLYPTRSYDALVGWDVVGKVMAYEGKIRSSLFTNIQFNAQCAYAPFCATNQGYWYLFFPNAYQFWLPLLIAGFSLVMWSRVRRWTGSPTAAGLSTFLVFLPPALTYQLTVGQTDIPVMVYTTLAFFAAAELLRGEGRVSTVAFYALIATIARSEGVLFALALTVVGILLDRSRRWRWLWITAVSVAFFALWNLFVMRFLIGYDPGQYFRRTLDFDPARMVEVVRASSMEAGSPRRRRK